MKQVLIAGCSGFLGGQLVKEALKRNMRVIGISSRPLSPSSPTAVNENFSHLQVNLADPSDEDLNRLQSVVVEGGVDACVHSIGSLFDSTKYKSLKSNDICSLISNYTNKSNINNDDEGALKKLNLETAQTLLSSFTSTSQERDGLKSFVYVSTEEYLLPMPWQRIILDQRYFQFKRQFEHLLYQTTLPSSCKKVVIRPGI